MDKIICDEIESYDKNTNFDKKKAICKMQNFYILLAFFFIYYYSIIYSC